MIKKTDFYLGVFLIMLTIIVKNDEIGPLVPSVVFDDNFAFGLLAFVAWWGTIICLIIKAISLFSGKNK